ncbi:MAG: hypothetical protein H0W76_13150 [Pyrinomonadaceae bacterium]|nr:hypothetical protein [Pyrinomonadaceae bacterium]
MFILKSKQQITRAIENAKVLHPKVRMVALWRVRSEWKPWQHLHRPVLPRREDR